MRTIVCLILLNCLALPLFTMAQAGYGPYYPGDRYTDFTRDTSPSGIPFTGFSDTFSLPLFSSAKRNRPALPEPQAIYRLRWGIDGGLSLAAAAAGGWGFVRIHDKAPLTQAELDRLKPADVNGFDRVALRQNPGQRDHARSASTVLLLAGASLPAALLLDRDIRQDWFDIGALYLETQLLNTTVYAWSPFGPALVDRIRPLSYYESLPLEERTPGDQRNSFYSGHVTGAACAAFFTAKVLSDYHPEWGGRRWLLYGAAAIPPAVMGYLRIRALRHYPSDVIVGGLVGAASGILIPELHRFKKGKLQMSLLYSDQWKGLALSGTF